MRLASGWTPSMGVPHRRNRGRKHREDPGSTDGAEPDTVDLLVDGVAVATLREPFVLDWETQSVSEGPHAFVVRASRCEQEFLGASHQVVVDRTKPTLVSRTPEDGSQWMSVHQTVRAELSEPVMPESVNGRTVRLLAGQSAVPAEVSLSQDGRILTLQPLEPLPVREEVRGDSMRLRSEGPLEDPSQRNALFKSTRRMSCAWHGSSPSSTEGCAKPVRPTMGPGSLGAGRRRAERQSRCHAGEPIPARHGQRQAHLPRVD